MTCAQEFNRRSSCSLICLFLSEENVKGLLIQAGKLRIDVFFCRSDDNLHFLIRSHRQQHIGSDCKRPPRPVTSKVSPKTTQLNIQSNTYGRAGTVVSAE